MLQFSEKLYSGKNFIITTFPTYFCKIIINMSEKNVADQETGPLMKTRIVLKKYDKSQE